MDTNHLQAKQKNYEDHPCLDVMRYWIGKETDVTHSWIQCHFNLSYKESFELVEQLVEDGTLQPKFYFDIVNEGYTVLRKTYNDELHPKS
jgi:hypothetical protein